MYEYFCFNIRCDCSLAFIRPLYHIHVSIFFLYMCIFIPRYKDKLMDNKIILHILKIIIIRDLHGCRFYMEESCHQVLPLHNSSCSAFLTWFLFVLYYSYINVVSISIYTIRSQEPGCEIRRFSIFQKCDNLKRTLCNTTVYILQ